jgi:hypothetical protein
MNSLRVGHFHHGKFVQVHSKSSKIQNELKHDVMVVERLSVGMLKIWCLIIISKRRIGLMLHLMLRV